MRGGVEHWIGKGSHLDSTKRIRVEKTLGHQGLAVQQFEPQLPAFLSIVTLMVSPSFPLFWELLRLWGRSVWGGMDVDEIHTGSRTHWLLTLSFIRTQSLTHLLSHSLTHSLTQALTRSGNGILAVKSGWSSPLGVDQLKQVDKNTNICGSKIFYLTKVPPW
jgi:hypothetical protein